MKEDIKGKKFLLIYWFTFLGSLAAAFIVGASLWL